MWSHHMVLWGHTQSYASQHQGTFGLVCPYTEGYLPTGCPALSLPVCDSRKCSTSMLSCECPPPVALLSALVCALLPGFTLSFPAHFSISSPGHDLEQEGSLSSLHLRSQPGVLWHREFRVACGSRHRCAWSQSQPVSGGGRGTQGYLLHMNLLELG